MRALHIVEPGRPLLAAEVPTPEPAPGEVLVRVAAAGICRTDVHYRRGPHTVHRFPMTPGHEIAGVIEAVGAADDEGRVGERVGIHYQTSCGTCRRCGNGREQFCADGEMIGRSRHGGYAEYVTVPARNAYTVPDAVDLQHASVMMCSSATSFHAIDLGRLVAGERVAILGCGGLGMSAIQIALAKGASQVYAVDLDPAKLDTAQALGALPIDARAGDVPDMLLQLTGGEGIDLALELVGTETTIRQAVDVLGVGGRAVIAGLGDIAIELAPFRQLVMREAEIIGVADHLGSDIPELFALAAGGQLVLDRIVTSCVPLDAAAVNDAMDRLESFGEGIRTIIVPG